MASYFLQCISLFFAAFALSKEDKEFSIVRKLFIGTELTIPLFLIGAIVDVKAVMGLGALSWTIGLTVGMILYGIKLKEDYSAL